MKHPLICLDFDGVIYDSAGLVFGFPEVAKIGRQRFMDAYREYWKTQEFLPESFGEFLIAKGLLTKEETAELVRRFSDLQEAEKFIYDDVLPFLAKFPKEMLAIVSRADPRWQQPKIERSGMNQYVSRVMIVQGEKGKQNALRELHETYEPIFHIDDDPKELAEIAGISGVYPLLLHRGKIPGVEGGYKNLEEVARSPLIAPLRRESR